MPKTNKTRHIFYPFMLGTAFALGALPAYLNLTVDPYQMFAAKDRPTEVNDIAEKAHYPLWKLAKFKRGAHDTIILGDSRARALRDKYWHELNITNALNLAYGGGTIPEVHSTYSEIKSDPAIRNLIIGVQLRSFDENHKGGMNRVPEAVRLVRHKLKYLKNWNVFKTTLKVLEKENEIVINQFGSVISTANAASLGKEGSTSLSKLLEPDVCFGCDLPKNLKPLGQPTGYDRYVLPKAYQHRYRGWSSGSANDDWGNYQGLYQVNFRLENLPSKFERQVRKNGASDWRSFEFSRKYWAQIEEIGAWAKAKNKNLIFVIPPTITNMQNTIHANGLSKLNHLLRIKLAELGTVIDLDFPNKLTGNVDHFNDAYHFNSKIARQIVGQIIPLITNNKDAIGKALKRERDLKCPNNQQINKTNITNLVGLLEGKNCRLWRAST